MSSSTYWLSIPPQDGLLVIPLEGRKIVSMFALGTDRRMRIKIAGYHTGETKWVGEQLNIIAIKIDGIPESAHSGMLPKIREALSDDLKGAEIVFLDDSYLSGKKKEELRPKT